MEEETLDQEPIETTTPEEVIEGVAPVDEGQTPTEPIVDEGIAKYFPNVAVTEENKAELLRAVKQFDALRELAELFNSEPDLAQAIVDFRNGEDFWVALAKYVDMDAIKPIEGEPNFSKWEENKKARMEKLTASEEKLKRIEENKGKTRAAIEAFMSENGISYEEFNPIMDMTIKLISAVGEGEITKELLTVVYKYMNLDDELKNAEMIGEQKGKNTKITDLMDKEQGELKGDGIPDLKGSAVPPGSAKKQNIFKARTEFRV